MCGGGGLGKVARIALPVLGGIAGGGLLGPAIGGAIGAPAAGTAIGTGIGSTAGGLAAGASPQKALLGGALSGLGSFALGPAGLNVGGAAGGATGSTAGDAATNVTTGLPSGAAGQAAGATTSAVSPAGAGVFGGEEAFLSGADFLGSDLASAAASGGGFQGLDSVATQNLAVESGLAQPIGASAPVSPVTSAPLAAPSLAPVPVTSSPLPPPDPLSAANLEQSLGLAPGAAGSNMRLTPEGVAPVTDMGSRMPWLEGAQGTGAQAATQAATQAAAGPGWLDKALSGIGLDPQTSKLGGFISENPGLILGGGGLAASAMMNQPSEYEDELQRLAEFYGQQGTEFSNYLRTGTLPPGAQEQLDQGADSAKAAIRSKHAAMGTSGSSMELQELNAVDERQKAQGFEYAVNLLNSGVQQSGLSSDLYNFLLNAESARDQNLQNAIGRFAQAAAA